MASVNEDLRDADISHQVDLQQYANGVVRKMIAMLNRTDSDLFAQLVVALEKMPPESFTVKRLEQLLASVRDLNSQAYAALSDDLQSELQDLAQYEASYQYQLFQTTIPAQIVAQVDIATVSAEQVYAAAMARPFQGRLMKEWASTIEEGRMARIRDAVRIGYVENQPIGDIVKRIRGTKAKGYSDGIIEIDRRHAEAVVRTAISHTAAFTRNRFLQANNDLIKAVVWTSTLDNRTSDMCRIRDGLKYTPDDHKPIGHKIPWLSGPGQLHWNCRSTSVPVTKSWGELGGVDIGEFNPETRASMDGQVPADTTYGEWLKKQSPERQDEILGKAKGALLRTGKLPFDKFYNDKGRALTLKQLRERYPVEYRDAGLDHPYQAPRGQRKDAIATFLQSKDEQKALLTKLYGDEEYPRQLKKVQGIKQEQGYHASDESLAAVRYYTGSGYAPINKRMREGGGTLEDRQFAALTTSSFPGIGEYKGEIWRSPTRKPSSASDWWERAQPGQPLDMGKQLTSFSTSQSFAAAWSGKSDLLLRIEKSKKGAYIEPLSLNRGEHEVLLPPGLKYRVAGKSVQTIAGREYRVIDLEIDDE